MAAGRKTLLDARAHRIPPGKDTKVLANGLMIAALAFANHVFDRPKWRELGNKAHDFVGTAIRPNGRLLHSWCAGEARHHATLSTIAQISPLPPSPSMNVRAKIDIEDAESFVDEIEQHYKDENGAYFFAANDTPNLIARTKTVSDNATPSGNGTLVGALARLYYLTGAGAILRVSRQHRTFVCRRVHTEFLPLSTLINSSQLLRRGQQIVIIGDRDDAETQSLVDCVHNRSLPDRILNVVATPDDLSAGHPAEGKEKLEARTTAYVCQGPVCSLPVNTAAGLTALLDEDPLNDNKNAR